MEIGLGVLKLAPAAFWSMTLYEFDAAVSGAMEAAGVEQELEAMSRDELDDLIREYGS